jgi:hypothetical protein
LASIARAFGMNADTWRRHANPWSVYTRFAAIPAMILAIWSRVWIGWWALIPVALVIVWLIVNPGLFSAVTAESGWAARGIYGERFWLEEPDSVPEECRLVLRWLILPGVAGFALLFWGLLVLELWPTFFGASLITLAQLWRIDRLGVFYEERTRRQ